MAPMLQSDLQSDRTPQGLRIQADARASLIDLQFKNATDCTQAQPTSLLVAKSKNNGDTPFNFYAHAQFGVC